MTYHIWLLDFWLKKNSNWPAAALLDFTNFFKTLKGDQRQILKVDIMGYKKQL